MYKTSEKQDYILHEEQRENVDDLDLSLEQKNFVMELEERPYVETVKANSLPESKFKAIKIVLKKDFPVNANEVVTAESLKLFPLVVTENIVLNENQIDDRMEMVSKNHPQVLHHDTSIFEGKNNSIGLYEGEIQRGEIKRQAPTVFADAKVYWDKIIEWLAENYQQHQSSESDSEEDRFWVDLQSLISDKENFLKANALKFDSVEHLETHIYKLGYQPNSIEGWMIKMAQSNYGSKSLARKIHELVRNCLYTENWDEFKMVMVDNSRLVHGRGQLPKDVKLSDIELIETPILGTNLDYLEN